MPTLPEIAAEFRKSTYFQWWQKTLRQRREAQLRVLPTTERESAFRDGALAELTWLLSAPDVAIHLEQAQREDNPAGFPQGYVDDEDLVN